MIVSLNDRLFLLEESQLVNELVAVILSCCVLLSIADYFSGSLYFEHLRLNVHALLFA